MDCRFITFKSDTGDCIFFILRDGEEQYCIMIDCGAYEDLIKDFVRKELHRKINLLIITHVDNDHILGIEEMLEEEKRIDIGKILFNCYQRAQDGQETVKFTENQKRRIEKIRSELGTVFRDIVENEVSVNEAVRGLSSIILSRPKLEAVWGKDYVLAEGRCDLDLGRWGRIRFVSPSFSDINRLDKKFRELLCSELFVDDANKAFAKQENIYELLLRYASLNDFDGEKLPEKDSADEVDDIGERIENAVEHMVKESSVSIENKASLAFVWEKDGHRVLFMGDARPGRIVEGLLRLYPTGPFPLQFDAIKVSHHGSHYNTTVELMRLIDSQHFFITGGGEEERPSEEALGRIICRPLSEGIECRTIHVNYPNQLTDLLAGVKTLQEKWHFAIDTERNEYEFSF